MPSFAHNKPITSSNGTEDASDFVRSVWSLDVTLWTALTILGWRDTIDAERNEGVYTSTAVGAYRIHMPLHHTTTTTYHTCKYQVVLLWALL